MQSRSRAERRRRRAEQRRVAKLGGAAERRGRATPVSVAGFTDAIATWGNGVLGNVLISRSNQRFERLALSSSTMQAAALPTLTGYFDLDVSLATLGAGSRAPVDLGSSWFDQLGWGLDSVAIATRFVMCAQMIGACVIARTQLERWSTNRAANIGGGAQRMGESTADWMDRIWGFDAPNIATWRSRASSDRPVFGAIDRRIESGQSFVAMSELLHGRGPLVDVLWWEAVDVGAPLGATIAAPLDTVTDALTLVVHHIQACIATAAEDQGNQTLAQRVWRVPITGPLHGQFAEITQLLRPIDLHVVRNRRLAEEVGVLGAHYRDHVHQVSAGLPTIMQEEIGPALAFADRRNRALDLAVAAIQWEEDQLGDAFNADSLAELILGSVFAGEMASVLALWLNEGGQHEASVAFAVCSSALRSSVWLWLEDDDRAMGCLRVLIEQIARARTWRIKPDAAVKLEARTETTPRDWIEKCGWRRLGVLLKSLGEFAHGADPNHWWAARDVLVALNPNADRSIAQMSGRTSCLADTIAMLDGECAAWLENIDADLAAAFWEITGLSRDTFDAEMESTMQRAWLQRTRRTRSCGGPP